MKQGFPNKPGISPHLGKDVVAPSLDIPEGQGKDYLPCLV